MTMKIAMRNTILGIMAILMEVQLAYNATAQECEAWSLLAGDGPTARAHHAMAYDTARNRIVMFGGSDSGGTLGDTWEWDGKTWLLVGTQGPVPRVFHAMAFDNVRQRVVLFGGDAQPGLLGDTWEWDGSTWHLQSSGGPAPRGLHSMAFDPVRQRTVLFGGGGATSYLPDTWEWDGTFWTQIAVDSPTVRIQSAMAFDVARSRMVLFGGQNSLGYLGDTWERAGTTWTLSERSGPSPRANHGMAFDSAGARVVLHGGMDASVTGLGDTWKWNGVDWIQASTLMTPGSRFLAPLVSMASDHRIVLFGGAFNSNEGQSLFGDTWQFAFDPAILIPPLSQTVQTSGTAILSVQPASTEGIEYQWRKNGSPLIDAGSISGSQSSNLVVDPILMSSAGVYDVVVTSDCGSIISHPATLTVLCRGDVDLTNVVNVPDLLIVIAYWGASPPAIAGADANGDGIVNVLDILTVINSWGPCP